MKFSGVFGFLTILKESVNLLPRNWRLTAFLAVLYVALSWMLSYAFSFSILSLSQEMLADQKSLVPDFSSFNASDPNSFPSNTSQIQAIADHIKQITATIFAVEIAFFFVFFFIVFFISFGLIFVSAVSYAGNALSVKDFASRIAKTWTTPLITSIHVLMQAMGYFLLVSLFAAPALMYPKILTISVAAFVGIIGCVGYIYLMIIWGLAVVVSVVEEGCCGLVAMGKASTLVKGQRLNGYMLNLFFLVLGLIIFSMTMIIFPRNVSTFYESLILAMISCLIKILLVMAYTVLYFNCKQQHGEQISVHDFNYKYAIQLPTTQHMN